MTLLWINKNRVTRFFQHLHSPKNASSLVLHTGFPTSLIDLFVKNRTHFTKPKSNKPLHRKTSEYVPPPPEIPESPSLTQLTTNENLHPNNGVVDSGIGVIQVEQTDHGSGSKTVLVTFFMMFVIVVSIVCVEKLTVGITVSAFVLLFLEYAVLSSTPNVEITDSLSFEEIKVGFGTCSEDSSDSSCDDFKLDCIKGDKKLDFSNKKVVDSCQVSLSENNKGRCRVKFNSKLKTFFAKKLRGCSKERKEKRGKELKVEISNVENNFEVKEGVYIENKSSLLVNVRQNMIVNCEEKRIDRVGNSCYLNLVMIALVGLVMGRLPALIIIMTWCLMLKIGGRFKCFVPNS